MSDGMALSDDPSPAFPLAAAVQTNGSDLPEYWSGTGLTLRSAIARSRVAIAAERDGLLELLRTVRGTVTGESPDAEATLDAVGQLLDEYRHAHHA